MADSRSAALFRRACRSLVGGVNSPVRAFKAVGGFPVFMESGKGAYLKDADGRRYIDYCLSWGPLILGHAREEIIAAAQRALKKGSTFGAATEMEVALAEALKAALPSLELLRLTSSGTEAVMSAIRLARAHTGRDWVIKFAGCYHGHVDSLLVQAGSGATTLGTPDSAGVPRAWAATTLNLPYNDLQACRRAFSKYGGKIAAVIVEPVAGNMGVVAPAPGFLQGLRELTRAHKALLIFDEVITGFRLCYGGAQSLFNIRPDLTCLGKIVGGGLPLAAYGGSRKIMERVAPLGPVYQAGTLSGNPVAVAAGLACLKLLKEENPYPRMEQLIMHLVQGLREEAEKAGSAVQLHSVGSMFTLFFCPSSISDYSSAQRCDRAAYGRFFNAMLRQGVYLPPAQLEAAFLSSAHDSADLTLTLRAARRAFEPA
ncbi:MAG: glutamate-1-semialdehyde 2,1-aminomutase [Elusimicrobia bacterium]|nr:glutamate-1-semialdehyde 2,1-aminomutase [Elusimicrobiota bacterium]